MSNPEYLYPKTHLSDDIFVPFGANQCVNMINAFPAVRQNIFSNDHYFQQKKLDDDADLDYLLSTIMIQSGHDFNSGSDKSHISFQKTQSKKEVTQEILREEPPNNNCIDTAYRLNQNDGVPIHQEEQKEPISSLELQHPGNGSENARNDFLIIEKRLKITLTAKEIIANSSQSKKVVEGIFRKNASLMKSRKGQPFRNQLKRLLPDVDFLAYLYKKSPTLYNYQIDKTRQNLRVEYANIIMKVSGSANAKAIEEYMRQDKLRFIFLQALPIIKQSQYKTRAQTQKNITMSDLSKADLYQHKITQLEKLAMLIEEENVMLKSV